MKKRTELDVDPVTWVIAGNIRAEIARRRISRKQLAAAVGCSDDSLGKYLRLDQCTWPVGLVVRIAKVLGKSVESLADVAPSAVSEMWWNPRYSNPKVLLDLFAEHEGQSEVFLTFDRYPACARMTDDVQRCVHLSRFAHLTANATGEILVESSNEWGDARRKRYLEQERGDLPSTITLMLRSHFELLTDLSPPFNLCTLEMVAANIEYLRSKCVIERGFKLLLIDDASLRTKPDLEFELSAVEGLGLIGKHFTFRKLTDCTVTCSEAAADAEHVLKILTRLRCLVTHGDNQSDIVAILDHYQRQVDTKLRERLSQMSLPSRDGRISNQPRRFKPR